jgi:hypothetical protein
MTNVLKNVGKTVAAHGVSLTLYNKLVRKLNKEGRTITEFIQTSIRNFVK